VKEKEKEKERKTKRKRKKRKKERKGMTTQNKQQKYTNSIHQSIKHSKSTTTTTTTTTIHHKIQYKRKNVK
jgi:hypothetical protein